MSDETKNCHYSQSQAGQLMCLKPGVKIDTVCGHNEKSGCFCKSYHSPQKFKMSNDPEFLQRMLELGGEGDCCSGGGLGGYRRSAMINPPTIDVSDFVKKRHLEELQFTHFNGSWEELLKRTKKQFLDGKFKEGYRDGVVLVQMSKEDAKDFYGYEGFKKFEGMKMEAVVEKVPGREHEPAKLQIKILEPKIRMRYVDIILYHKTVLQEDGDRITVADWEIISINGRLRKKSPPMEALTMIRNYRHLPGGTSMPDKDPVEFLDELMDAVLFEKGMKHLIKKKK